MIYERVFSKPFSKSLSKTIDAGVLQNDFQRKDTFQEKKCFLKTVFKKPFEKLFTGTAVQRRLGQRISAGNNAPGIA
jgi:hypothetical protein